LHTTCAQVGGTLKLHNASLLPQVYDVDMLPESLTRSFRLPCAPPTERDEAFRRKTLGPRKKWDTSLSALPTQGEGATKRAADTEDDTPFEPLVLWRPPADATPEDGYAEQVAVDEILCRKLRQHQREGTQFLFECLMNEPRGEEGEGVEGEPNRTFRAFKGQGCILADDMGLGKTLQSITILHTLLRQGFKKGDPAVKKALIVCPTSLVGNWESEIGKWLKTKAPHVLTLGSIEPVEAMRRVGMFKTQSRSTGMVLVLSYEMARKYIDDLVQANPGLLICDEAHRLKNDKTATAVALDRLRTPRRVLLSGTPVQNDLDEFFSMVNFCNPGVLGDERFFHKTYATPILRGREPDATDEQSKRGEEKGQALGNFCHMFILRRTNTILSKHLPPKLVQVVCVGLSHLQLQLYHHFLDSKRVRAMLSKNNQALPVITLLKKLCNHPLLIREASSSQVAGYEECLSFFPPDYGRAREGARADTSGKLAVLERLLAKTKAETDDRFVLVSNYTSMLDVFALLAREHGWSFVRLDGSTSQKKRTALVSQFNDPATGPFLFLLSSKAGGCGLNLIGANRLVLFDPDWNPANDKQAAARVWRDGQRKHVYIYRFITAGTIEEFVYERQLSKEGLSGVASNEQVLTSALSTSEMRDLFTLHDTSRSHFHDKLKCERCAAMLAQRAGERTGLCVDQLGAPKETDGLEAWAHHHGPDTVDDVMMRHAGEGIVPFIFSLAVEGKDMAKAAEEERAVAEAEARALAERAAAEAAAPRGKENASKLQRGPGGARIAPGAGADRTRGALPGRAQPRPVRPSRAAAVRAPVRGGREDSTEGSSDGSASEDGDDDESEAPSASPTDDEDDDEFE